MRDNQGMAIVPAGLVHRGQLDIEIKTAVGKLGPEATHVSYSLGEDSTGEPSIFFRIVLTDTAAGEENLADITGRIATALFNEIRPIENWGLHPYFNFRSVSEQQRRKDPEWAT
jgi:hypothetical protein